MNQHERVVFIYKNLEDNPKTIQDIYTELLKNKVTISRRQIYLDIDMLRSYYLRDSESLKIDTGRYNQKIYRLIKKSDTLELNNSDITTFQLTRTIAPRIINNGRSESMKKFRNVYKSFVSNGKSLYTFMTEGQNVRSSFFEALYDDQFNTTLDDIVWSIANAKLMLLIEVEGDATSTKEKIHFPFQFKPIKLIFHRGDYVVAGFEKSKNIFLVFNIAKIKKYELTKTNFPNKKLLSICENELQNRFGISNNINKKVYHIKLEFSSITGEFISHYHWHQTQKFHKLENENWILEMDCGINRELIGWIFMWMSNVRILAPSTLKQVFLDQMKNISNIYKTDGNLKYKNIFTQLNEL